MSDQPLTARHRAEEVTSRLGLVQGVQTKDELTQLIERAILADRASRAPSPEDVEGMANHFRKIATDGGVSWQLSEELASAFARQAAQWVEAARIEGFEAGCDKAADLVERIGRYGDDGLAVDIRALVPDLAPQPAPDSGESANR